MADTAATIITKALHLFGINDQTEDPTATDMANCVPVLNDLLRQEQADGACQYLIKRVAVQLPPGSNGQIYSFSVGTGSSSYAVQADAVAVREIWMNDIGLTVNRETRTAPIADVVRTTQPGIITKWHQERQTDGSVLVTAWQPPRAACRALIEYGGRVPLISASDGSDVVTLPPEGIHDATLLFGRRIMSAYGKSAAGIEVIVSDAERVNMRWRDYARGQQWLNSFGADMGAINILGSFQDPKNLDEGAGKLVNVRVVPRAQQEGKPAVARFVGAPGLPVVCKPTASPCIAICHALGTIWSGHADGSIYYGVETAAPALAGMVAVNAQQPIIRFAEDRTALVITSNRNTNNVAEYGTAYTATQAAGVVNSNFDASISFDPSACAEMNNFAVYSGASNFYANQDAKMYSSVALAPASVLPNSFATKEARADRVVDLAVSGLVLWPMGARSLEQWYAPGGQTDFAFVAYPNSLTEVGLAARASLATLRGLIVFVATDRRVWACMGQSGKPVSPAWVDLLLQQLTADELATLTGYAYGQGGGDFYVLTLPGLWTIELCSTTGVWSYRQSPGGRLDHAGRCATEDNGGITYVGLDTGEICTIDLNSSSEPAGTLSRLIQTPWVGSEEARQTYNSIDITSSMGPAAGSFQLDWSVDKGQTWRGARQILMPQPGTRRSLAQVMGTSRRRQFRLQYSGTQAPFTIDELFANVTPGT